MDKFVTKSSSTCNSTGSKSKSNNYGKDCEVTMKKKMTNEMTGRVFLDANLYWAGSNEVQIMLQVAKHGFFIFFPELGLATWFCKGSVTIINFDHCELIGISSSFCRASNCTCQLPRDKFCQTYSSDPDHKFFSQFSKLFFCYRTLFGAVTSSF